MAFQKLSRHCSALSEHYYVVDTLGDEELEANLRAAAHVAHGGMLHKFRKSGREKPHRRFVRVTGGGSPARSRRSRIKLSTAVDLSRV